MNTFLDAMPDPALTQRKDGGGISGDKPKDPPRKPSRRDYAAEEFEAFLRAMHRGEQ